MHSACRKTARASLDVLVECAPRCRYLADGSGHDARSVCLFCVCVFFFSRVSDDDADQAPSAERPFWCVVDSLPICSAAFLLRTALSRGFE